MLKGCLVAESLRVGSALDGIPLRVTRVWRGVAATATAEQPPVWTLMDFEVPVAEADRLATALAGCLAPTGGWYADFSTPTETFVVFAGRVFRYQRGDTAGRAAAQAHARSVGVPEPQLDWSD